MKIFLAGVIANWFFCGSVYPQAETKVSSKIVKAEDGKPAVYVSVERRDKEKVWLRLTNNTSWAIAVRTFSFYFNRKRTTPLASGGDVFTLPDDVEIDSLHYYIEKERGSSNRVKAPEVVYSDSSSISWIAAKASILFCVPIKQLDPGLMTTSRISMSGT